MTILGDNRILYEWVLTSPDRILWCTDERLRIAIQGTFGVGEKAVRILSFYKIFLPASAIVLFIELDIDFD